MSPAPGTAVTRFAAEWDECLRAVRSEPPALARYVPDGSAVRLAVLTELVRVDLRQRWRRAGPGSPAGGVARRVSEYAAEFPELAADPLYLDLVCEEFEVRQYYQHVRTEQFLAEYPDLATELRERLPAEDESTEVEESGVLQPGVEVGARLDDFDLLTVLGGDGRARVFLARQRSMQRLVAVRVEAGSAHDPRTVAQLDHQYIVRVFDQRLLPAGRGAGPLRLQYMQYLPGGTAADLLDRLRTTGPAGGVTLLRSVDTAMEARGEIRPTDSSVRAEISGLSWPETVAWIGVRLASALDYADRQGIPHRAIKPENILFTSEGVPKLGDFTLPGASGPLVIDPGVLPYQAPEQLRARIAPVTAGVDTRADLYALGALLWEMLTGASPFDDSAQAADTPGRPGPGSGTAGVSSSQPERPVGRTVSDSNHSAVRKDSESASIWLPKPDPAPDASGDRSTPASSGDPLAERAVSVSKHTDPKPNSRKISEPAEVDTADRSAGQRIAEMVAVRVAGVPAAARDRLPADTPATLRRVLLRCLAPDPGDRWQSGAELAAQLELCLDSRARDLVDPPPTSLRYRARNWLLPVVAVCVGLPNLLASLYNVMLNQTLIVDGLKPVDQDRFHAVALINNVICFGLAAVVMLILCRRPLAAAHRLARGRSYPVADLARVRAETLALGDRLVWAPFVLWLAAGMIWPLALMRSGVMLPSRNFVQFYTAQVVCAAIALAYPFFLITVYAVRSVYPQLLVAGGVGPQDGMQLRRLARRSNFFLAAAASVPLLGVASATFVPAGQLVLVIGPVRTISVGGILAFVVTYWLFRLLEADLRALARAIPRGTR